MVTWDDVPRFTAPWFTAGLPLPRPWNPAYALVSKMPRFLELVPELQMRENVWRHWLGPWGFQVLAYPVASYSLETFFDEALRMVLDLVLLFVLVSIRYAADKSLDLKWRRLSAITLSNQLILWSICIAGGQSRVLNFLRGALAFRSSLLLWDIFTIRPVAEVESWSNVRMFAQLWLFPVETSELAQDPERARRPRLKCLRGLGKGLVYLLFSQLFLLFFPPIQVVVEMPKYQYMAYALPMVFGLYVMLSSTGFFVMNILGLILGVEQAPLFENPFLTTSVQKFWSRWNRAISTVLHRVVFGGTHSHDARKQRSDSDTASKPAPSLARFAQTSLTAMTTFLVSGLFHEFLLYCATPGLFGWQTLFFLLNGALAVASNALSRYAPDLVRRTPVVVRYVILLLFCCRTAHLFFVPLQTHNMLAEPQMLFQLFVLPRHTPPTHAYFLNLF